jgi:predicted dithiol-disulfide oxidoreductase (DUF899 family)
MSTAEAETIPHPPIATREDWLEKRKELLQREKELTRQYDKVNASRRRLPMVELEKPYMFDSPEGQVTLLNLFEGRRQLIVYHFMFGPDWEAGCQGCTGLIDAMGDLSLLAKRDTSFALVSRAPLDKLTLYKEQKNWPHTWVSSFGSDFNYDFHATTDKSVANPEYNYAPTDHEGEQHAMSVFFRLGDRVYHTYSTYARGCENLVHTYALLDITPYGRQEDFEDSPPNWPQRPTYG